MDVADAEEARRWLLPVLPLDTAVPESALARRNAISFGSSDSCCCTLPRPGRRGGISHEKTDKNAIYVRMLGDVRMKSKIDLKSERRNSNNDSDYKIVEGLAGSDKSRMGLRFLTLHKVRWKRRPCFQLSADNASLLDEHYDGLAQCMLSHVGNWNFDIFNLDSLTSGKSLFHIALHLFHEYCLLDHFHLDIVKLMRCFTLIEDGYHDNNPYHNVIHAADVTQAMHCFLREQKLCCCISPMEVMAALFAAMTHDLEHPGVNQAFLIATSNHLASLYENFSVLEHHHWRSAVGVLHESGVFNHFNAHQWGNLEWQLKSLILATDITRQPEFLKRFKNFLDNKDFDIVKNTDNRHFIIQIALKCADISNPCRPWKASKQWSERVCDEFFQQGDYERSLMLPVTPQCDRYLTTTAKIQAGFMEFVVSPLFKEWHRFTLSPLSEDMLNNVIKNKTKWDKEKERESKEEKQRCDDVEDVMSQSSAQGAWNEPEGNSESEEDIVRETRFTVTYSTREDDQPESRQSLSPVSENMENFAPDLIRRHSMPPVFFKREVTRLTIRRESFPRAQYSSRKNVPRTIFYQATSVEGLPDKFTLGSSGYFANGNKSISIEGLLARPKITTLSTSSDASKLASRLLSSSDPHLAQRSQLASTYNKASMKSTSRLASLLAGTAISPPAETDSFPIQTFQPRTVLAPLSSNNQQSVREKFLFESKDSISHLKRVSPVDLAMQVLGGKELLSSVSNMESSDPQGDTSLHSSCSEPVSLSKHVLKRTSDEGFA